MKLFLYELKKIALKQYALFIFLAVIVVQLFSLTYDKGLTYGLATETERSEYLETIRPLTGKLNEEKENIIIAMKDELMQAQQEEAEIYDAYTNWECTADELNQTIDSIKPILDKEDITEAITAQYDYVCEDKEHRVILPSSAIPIMDNDPINYLMLLAVIFCCAYAVMAESSTKGDLMLRTTPNGQRVTMGAKLIILALLITVTSVILSCVDLIQLSRQLPLEYWEYDLCSLARYECTPFDISIIWGFFSVQLLKLTGYLFIGAAAMLTAFFTKSYPASVFPYIAIPVAADYVAEGKGQSYYLPTGLIKGYGYLYGNVGYYEQTGLAEFYGIPVYYTTAVVIFSVAFIAAASVIMIGFSANRLKKLKHGAKKAALLASVMVLLLSGCSQQQNVIYNGIVSIIDGATENSRYTFAIKDTTPWDQEGGYDGLPIFLITYTDKESGQVYEIPRSLHGTISMNSQLFATENYLYYSGMNLEDDEQYIERINLSDMSRERIYTIGSGEVRSAFGLTIDYDEETMILSIKEVFSNDKELFFTDHMGRVFSVDAFKNRRCIIEENTKNGLFFDGENICYVTEKLRLMRYNISSGKTDSLYDAPIDPDSLAVENGLLHFETNGKKYAVNISDLSIAEE